jgi:hypothetical protein
MAGYHAPAPRLRGALLPDRRAGARRRRPRCGVASVAPGASGRITRSRGDFRAVRPFKGMDRQRPEGRAPCSPTRGKAPRRRAAGGGHPPSGRRAVGRSRWLGEQADQRGGFLPDSDAERPISSEPLAWAVRLFGDENVLWAVSERVEHAAAGRLAHNVGASSVDHTEGKEWLRHMPSARSTRRPSSTAWRGCESRGAWPLA